MNKLLTVAPSPHEKGGESVSKIMYGVVIALLPALIMSAIFFGWHSIKVTAIAVAACILFEFIIQKYIAKGIPTITDGSAIVTGILLAFNVPVGLPVWLIILGSFIAIAVGKMSFGGLGQNPFNPALVGRVFLLISFPVQMTTWSPNNAAIDGFSGATPLGLLKEALKSEKTIAEITSELPMHFDLFWGNISGSLGEISAVALLLGGLYMLFKKIITWHTPVSLLGTMVIFQGILWLAAPDKFADPIFHILTGGAMLGAIFMATDMVSSPMTGKGQLFYGAGIAIITICIRNFGAYPEGISFAILIMNGFAPLINSYVKPKRFGGSK